MTFYQPDCKKIEFYSAKTGKIAPNMILYKILPMTASAKKFL